MGNGEPERPDEPGAREAAVAVLRRVAEAKGRLLRAERSPGAARAAARLRLAFDVGVIVLECDAARGALTARVDASAAASPELVNADEEEPWWALLGHPLTRVEPHEEQGLLLQIRHDDASPRVLVLEPAGGAVRLRTLV